MELAKGNIKERMSGILGLTKGECMNIVNFSDQIYKLEEETKAIEDIIKTFERYRNDNDLSEEEKEESFIEYKKLEKDELYCTLVEDSTEFRKYSRENMNKPGRAIDKKIVYLENICEENRLCVRELTRDFLEIVYRRYFKDAIKARNSSYEQMKTYEELYKKLSDVMKMDKTYDENKIYKNSDVAEYVCTEYNSLLKEFTMNSLQEKSKTFREGLKDNPSSQRRVIIASTTGKPLDVEAEFGKEEAERLIKEHGNEEEK